MTIQWTSIMQIKAEMDKGTIRTFAAQGERLAQGIPCTPDESSARRAYIGHILSHPTNFKRLP